MRVSTRSRASIATLLVLVLVLAAVPGLAAADTRTGGTVVVERGQTVRGGLDVFAGSVVVRGTVQGDLSAVAGDVTVAETGRVTGSVSAASGNVRVDGTVDGDLDAGAGSVVIGQTGAVGGDLRVGAGNVAVDGTVGGSAVIGADTIVLGDGASIAGDVRYDGTLRDQGATVGGRVIRDDSIATGPTVAVDDRIPGVLRGVFAVYAFLVNLVAGAILLLVLPEFSDRVAAQAVDRPLASGGVGLLAVVAVPAVLVLAALTIIGIPLSVVGAILFGLVAWVGALYGRFAVGTWLLSYTDVENRWAAFAVGLLLVALAIRVPLVGALVDLLVLLLGLGALALVLTEKRRERRSARSATDVDTSTA
ncbi:MAG: polymer-forming cytoskeletal protein [Haloarculaceae archaeon]